MKTFIIVITILILGVIYFGYWIGYQMGILEQSKVNTKENIRLESEIFRLRQDSSSTSYFNRLRDTVRKSAKNKINDRILKREMDYQHKEHNDASN